MTVKNPLADGSIGKFHGSMNSLVTNPFQTRFMRANFDAAISGYDEHHGDFIHPWGRRCIGNAWAGWFWVGFDNTPINWDAASKQSAGYAFYCAGRAVSAAIEKVERSGNRLNS